MLCWATDDKAPLMHAEVSVTDRASLQRGAHLFVNYCMGCHSAKYVRYERLVKDLGIPREVLLSNLVFDPAHKVSSTMSIAMSQADGKRYFSTAPPDLSLAARAHGPDWIYSFLHSFYASPSRPTGADNLVFPGTAMPHVLWQLQGIQRPVYRTEQRQDGSELRVLDRLEMAVPGSLSADEYSRTILDVVNFLVYLSEPVRLQRERVGIWVILYLLVLAVIVWFLKKEYWRDVH